MYLSSRILCCLLLTLTIAGPTLAAASPEVLPLWPAGTLDADTVRGPERVGREGSGLGAVANISEPRMAIHRPARPNGTAVVIAGGGGYFRIQIGRGSEPVAKWLNAVGITAAILYYRLPGDGWPAAAPFADGQRAIRLLRARADELGIDPQRIGVIGMSAGGHLGAILGSRFETAFYEPVDAVDGVSPRPDFTVLLYPVISMAPPLDTTRSRQKLGTDPDVVEAYSAERHVQPRSSPAFLAHSLDDPIAAPDHSRVMAAALEQAGVPVELHLFDSGGHSWGIGLPGTATATWPRLFITWARQQGFVGTARSRR